MVKRKNIFFVDVEVEFAQMVGLSGRFFWRVAEKGRTSTCMWLMFWKNCKIAGGTVGYPNPYHKIVNGDSPHFRKIHWDPLQIGRWISTLSLFLLFFLGWNPFHDFQFRGSNLSGDPSSTEKQVSLAPPQQKSTNNVFFFRHNRPALGFWRLVPKKTWIFSIFFAVSSNKKTFQGVVSGNASSASWRMNVQFTLKLGILVRKGPCRSK